MKSVYEEGGEDGECSRPAMHHLFSKPKYKTYIFKK